MTLISEEIIKGIKDQLKDQHPEVYLEAFLSEEAREVLKILIKDKNKILLADEEKLEYVIQEIVGLGVIDELLKKHETTTDISFNGTFLTIETPEEKWIHEEEITENYINKLITKFANAVGKGFSPKEPILDAGLGYLRINAVHKVLSPYGTTMSLRVSKPKLALNEENFEVFAPFYMLDFFKAAVKARSNIVISGDTGTGKTELAKLLTSYIHNEKIIVAEDTLEGHYKELFPDKDIMSWLTSPGFTYKDLIKAALRNNPVWINIAETRGEEAYEMIQAVLSGHRIITTAHTVDARATPTRFVNMAKMGYQVEEQSLKEDIYRYFQFGFHIKKKKINGKTVRFLSEIVEYLEGEKTLTVFETEEDGDNFIYHVGNYSEAFSKRLREFSVDYQGLPKEAFLTT
ncbi:CpaF/VirB11 family protein [Bacillus sp. Au-Bac7]|uniref:CpaF/VirB11 family protein n=1 Tax=Bacillus sp. Au-Bac7 TaxID=2906458 RepID=UPI001E45CB08|nr:CpaF/VirB11 family protein [Bacillus sp. Au-Bac7]MCE4051691.1 CpaF/VirB11 family protein [Bacillus sp. Au-Bac7]